MLYKRGKIYWCEFHIEGQRFRFSTKVTDKSLAKEIEQTIKSDIIRKRFEIPVKNSNTLLFKNAFAEYISTLTNIKSTIDVKITASKHFMPVFQDKKIKSITPNDIKEYQLKRKKKLCQYINLKKNRKYPLELQT